MAFLKKLFHDSRDDSTPKPVFRELLLDFKNGMATGFPKYAIPPLEPLSFDQASQFDKKSAPVRVKGNLELALSEVNAVGLSALNVVELNWDSTTKAVVATISVKHTSVTGKYGLQANGTPVSGSGSFSVEIYHVWATIPLQTKGDRLDFESIKDANIGSVRLEVGRINKVCFDKLDCDEQSLGGPQEDLHGLLGAVLALFFRVHTATILQNELQKFMQGELKNYDEDASAVTAKGVGIPSETTLTFFHRATHYPTYDAEALRAAAAPAFRKQERRMHMVEQTGEPLAVTRAAVQTAKGNLDQLFDFLVPNINALIAKQGLDPYTVSTSPEYSFSWLGISGGVKLESPTVYGLSHLKRTGPVNIDGLTVSANIGTDGGLSGGTGMQLWFLFVKLAPHASYTLSNINIRAEITLEKDRNGQTKLALKSLEADDPKVSLDIDGLGVYDWLLGELTGFLTTFLVKAFKGEILKAVENAIRKELKDFALPI